MELRDYQLDAVAATYEFIQRTPLNGCVVIPTGGGKTPVIAQFCKDAVLNWNSRVLVLAHVKELLQQSAAALQRLCPTVPVGCGSPGPVTPSPLSRTGSTSASGWPCTPRR